MIIREPIKPATRIFRWEDWPDDVREELRAWNRERIAGVAGRPWRLSFYRTGWGWPGNTGERTFRCDVCKWLCWHSSNGTATLAGYRRVCDECLIDLARRTISDRALRSCYRDVTGF